MSTALVRPATPIDVLTLQYGNRNRLLGWPLYILGAVAVMSVLISLIIQRAGGTDQGGSYNAGVLWSLTGFFVAIGVQNTSATFPFALALGSTRRTFALGNLLTFVAQAAYTAAVATVLLLVETATGGWFVGTRVLGVDMLGGGNPALLLGWLFLALLTAQSAGAVFGAAWVRFGALGPGVLGLALLLVGALAVFLFLPQLAGVAAAFRPWWLPVGAAVVIAASTVGEYVLLRRASVR